MKAPLRLLAALAVTAPILVAAALPADAALPSGDCSEGPYAHTTAMSNVALRTSVTDIVATCDGKPVSGTLTLTLDAPDGSTEYSHSSSIARSGPTNWSFTPHEMGTHALHATFAPSDGSSPGSWDESVQLTPSSVSLYATASVGWFDGEARVSVAAQVTGRGWQVVDAVPTGTITVRNAAGHVLMSKTLASSTALGVSPSPVYARDLVDAREGDVLDVTYSGDDQWAPSERTITVTDSRATPSITLRSGGQTNYATVIVDVVGTDEGADPGGVTITAKGHAYVLPKSQYVDATHTEYADNLPLSAGTYPISVHFGGTKKLKAADLVQTATFDRAPLQMASGPKRRYSTAAPGTTNAVSVTLTDNSGRRAPGVLVTFQQRVGTSTTWRTLGSARTASNGVANLSFKAASSRYIRAVISANTQYTPTSATRISHSTHVTTKRAVSARAATISGHRTKARLSVTSSPGGRATLQVRRAGAWHTVQKKSTGHPTGRATTTFTVSKGATSHTYRVVVAADANGTQAASQSIVVKKA